jgi:hypothetical protein
VSQACCKGAETSCSFGVGLETGFNNEAVHVIDADPANLLCIEGKQCLETDL